MKLYLHTFTPTNGTVNLYLAVDHDGEPSERITSIIGKTTPTGTTIEMDRLSKIPGVNVENAMNAIEDEGWAVFGSGFVQPPSVPSKPSQ